jgi:formamidopyrimidine-DNA glycosylase
MPELPEVETIRLQLEKFLVGHRIEKIEVKNPRYEIPQKDNLLGSEFIGVRRFAKVLSLDLSNKHSIVVHIKLTGQLIYRGPNLKEVAALSKKVVGGVPGAHTHIIFYLDRGGVLYYNDIRRFGWVRVVGSDQVVKEGFISKLGPEPAVTDNFTGRALTFEDFKKILSRTKRAIKVVLMDQTKIGGVGNIYANDALWLAKIDPKRPADKITEKETEELYDSINKVLRTGLKYGGASELAFVTPDGREGKYQEHSLVYGRENMPCKRCHTAKIKKYFLSGRGTYFCPACQK